MPKRYLIVILREKIYFLQINKKNEKKIIESRKK